MATLLGKHYFPNGYGASVISNEFSYRGSEGLFEVAVLDEVGNLDYSTPITSDVVGHLSESEAWELLERIKALPSRNKHVTAEKESVWSRSSLSTGLTTSAEPQLTVKSKDGYVVGSGWLRDGEYGRYLSITLTRELPTGTRIYVMPTRKNAGLLG